ncbi:MAG TPA: TauD/TfdA family dioxygenase [Acidimicrobiia bacterium]|nr:TauD/TfdA family dioxygenase [Acidimicrobiia bacterium]
MPTTAPPVVDLEEAARTVGQLPHVVAAVRAFAADSGHRGALLLHGLPVGAVPSTPTTPVAPPDKDPTSELVLLGVAQLLGEPVGYEPEHGGDLVQNIVPLRGTEARQVSTSSAVTLAWHTETAFHPHKPRYLLLLCVRGDPHAATTLASVHDVVTRLDDTTLTILRAPRFRTRPDESFLAAGSNGAFGAPFAVLATDARGSVCFTYDEQLTVGIDPAADAALTALQRAVDEVAVSFVLTVGDLLIVDNHVAVHGRGPFHARFDGTDRWLQRAFVVTDLAPSASERRGRIITTRF